MTYMHNSWKCTMFRVHRGTSARPAVASKDTSRASLFIYYTCVHLYIHIGHFKVQLKKASGLIHQTHKLLVSCKKKSMIYDNRLSLQWWTKISSLHRDFILFFFVCVCSYPKLCSICYRNTFRAISEDKLYIVLIVKVFLRWLWEVTGV